MPRVLNAGNVSTSRNVFIDGGVFSPPFPLQEQIVNAEAANRSFGIAISETNNKEANRRSQRRHQLELNPRFLLLFILFASLFLFTQEAKTVDPYKVRSSIFDVL